MSRVALVEALHQLEEFSSHPAVQSFVEAAVADEAAMMEVILTVPDSLGDFLRREQAIGELRVARNNCNWISDWKQAAVDMIADYDNNNKPPTTTDE